ncbi:MAG: hypothetical protein JOZ81_01935 [Chloroflexi bacterium]|nr:hypothetical protein [Chloroflexota bacterium]
MNLVDFERIPVRELLGTIEAAALEHGTEIARREIIGMIPRAAWAMAPEFYEGCVNFDRKLIVEDRLGL